ncbi:MAG: hypothetical protein HZB56_06945 [Deltaproteobacteria bacterium]|nr:hypothetical protein [Deltaproteobacteria bacterium]
MRSAVLAAGGGILLLGAGSILLISRLDPEPVATGGPPAVLSPAPSNGAQTGGSPAASLSAPPGPGAPSATAPGVLVPGAVPLDPGPAAAPADRQRLRATAARRLPQATATPVAAAGPATPEPPRPEMPPAPDPAAWAQVPVVSPFGAGTPAPAVTRELGRLRPELSACFGRESQARYARLGAAFSRAPGSPPATPPSGPAMLLLEVESDGQVMQVLDAPVEIRGGASDATLSCAQAVLRGARLAVPSQGQARFRMRFQLKP